ncbi:hypothetical protein E2C01_006155 [Portunus trituberculatus]|uniref:Uncharacterized protein n=1 Tax=Portunus trituberculatus TaxID=210409 RepID=A0A5B7CVL1_PORTR|nr:hypothetical protein [Portunus trituberculatus]
MTSHPIRKGTVFIVHSIRRSSGIGHVRKLYPSSGGQVSPVPCSPRGFVGFIRAFLNLAQSLLLVACVAAGFDFRLHKAITKGPHPRTARRLSSTTFSKL